MAASPRLREPVRISAPSIYINSATDRYDSQDRPSGFGAYSSSIAMSIPGSGEALDAPPPLPPPRFVPIDTGEGQGFTGRESSALSPRDQAHSGSVGSFADDQPSYKRRGTGSLAWSDKDEGYASLSSAYSTRSDTSLSSFAAAFGRVHSGYQLESSADAFTNHMKKKLDPLKTFDNKPPSMRSLLSASAGETFPRKSLQDHRLPALSVPTNLPLHIKPDCLLSSPDRFTQTPLQSAISPHSQPFAMGSFDRSFSGLSDQDRSPPRRSQRTNSDDVSISGSCEAEEVDRETSSMNRLHIDDSLRLEGQAAGIKRRASSPPVEDQKLLGLSSQSSLIRRREMASRGSPTPRLSTIPQGSVSSASSTDRSGSFASNLSLLASTSITRNSSIASSYGRLSPGDASQGGVSPLPADPSCTSPYSTPMSLNPSPRGSISRSAHQRTISENRPLASPRKLTDLTKPGSSKIQGFFMCECCPKKPRKFETAEELHAHESEKQYECSFCGNRFKNKNEAERHQNSLHVRRHSWSCSALSDYGRAFHESTNRPGEADTCGYCGEEFARTGPGPDSSSPRRVSEQDWDERVQHLQEVHKFRECNSGKKFFRADHFRQHLKHSHAGTSGKWTNMLENACMVEEGPSPR